MTWNIIFNMDKTMTNEIIIGNNATLLNDKNNKNIYLQY